MRMLILLVSLYVLNTYASFGNGVCKDHVSTKEDTAILYPPRHHLPMDSVVAGFDRLLAASKELTRTVKDGMKKEGVVGYIQNHRDVFLQVFAFILLYGWWLRKKKRV